ncbi:hypothetical protein ACHAW5_006552 [Stephanodiscus triporus]|uniref:Uncharacterized protein n=1 Tax=Stephanodiscus triporus TaxID=2934178 RepID=A0ABD3MLB5_9STRA
MSNALFAASLAPLSVSSDTPFDSNVSGGRRGRERSIFQQRPRDAAVQPGPTSVAVSRLSKTSSSSTSATTASPSRRRSRSFAAPTPVSAAAPCITGSGPSSSSSSCPPVILPPPARSSVSLSIRSRRSSYSDRASTSRPEQTRSLALSNCTAAAVRRPTRLRRRRSSFLPVVPAVVEWRRRAYPDTRSSALPYSPHDESRSIAYRHSGRARRDSSAGGGTRTVECEADGAAGTIGGTGRECDDEDEDEDEDEEDDEYEDDDEYDGPLPSAEVGDDATAAYGRIEGWRETGR